MNKKVLVVDDDADTRTLLAYVLSEYSVDVVEAAGDDEAYQRFLEVGPDLILLDVLLPRQGGLALLRKIRGVRGGREVPVLIMSALYKEADVRAEAVDRLGALDFLKKPFQMDVLRAKLEEVLGDHSSGKDREAQGLSPPSELLTRGDLSTYDFPVLLNNMGLHRVTGRLHVRRDDAKKILYLREGEVTFALSNRVRETLGRHLLSAGLVTEEQYRAGLEAMQRDGKRLGEFVVEQGAVTADEVNAAIRANVVEKIEDIFSWTSGDFLVTPYEEPLAPLPGGPIPVGQLLWEGVRKRFPYGRISAVLSPNVKLSLFPCAGAATLDGEMELSEEQQEFLRVLHRFEGKALGKVLADIRGQQEMRFLYFLLVTGRFVLASGEDGVATCTVDLPSFELIRRSRRRLDTMRRKNCFQILEVPLDATDAKVREAYLQLAKEVHPDMLGPHDPSELPPIHGEMFHLVQTAYETLKTSESRRQYLDFIQKGLAEDVSDGSRALEAETRFMEGQGHLKKRAWDAAAVAFRKAVALVPDEGEYLSALGIALLKRASKGRPAELAEAEKSLLRAAALLPESAEPHYHLGQIASGNGDTAKAIRCFQAALERNPNHAESQRELRLLRAKSGKMGGVLSAILGKKETGA